MFWRWATVILLCVSLTFSFHRSSAQSIQNSPPKIEFPDWRHSGSRDSSEIYELAFPSAIVTDTIQNNTVPLRVFIPRDTKAPTPAVIVLHYWGASDLKVEENLARELNRRNVSAVLVTLPYHMLRTPPGSGSGEKAIQSDPTKLMLTMTQAVSDVRRAIDWIETRKEFQTGKVGIMGTSLGAVVASLTYAVEPRISNAAFLLGGADIAHILWHSSRVVVQREELRKKGYTESKLREAIKEIEPLQWLQKRGPGTTFVIGARFDTVIPHTDTQKLIDALPNAKTLWIDTGHYGGFVIQSSLLSAITRFFANTLYDLPYKPPSRLFAPTIRAGATLDIDAGIQVGIGMDLWRNSPDAEAFGNLMFTPRGAQFFLGRRLDKNFSLGIIFKPKRTTFGAFWSVVF